MWLLNTNDLKLEWFTDCSCVPYAILSHRWQDEEVTFIDIQSDHLARQRKGYQKVVKASRHAVNDGLSYIWIDTCCINKESSAELSESINSMFQWYEKAVVCYAYLYDVHPGNVGASRSKRANRITRSEWFERGWTLQELIAPWKVVFLDKEFVPICQKIDIASALSAATGIDKNVLCRRDLHSISVAQRMSWASNRRTTRVEDEAYSLLGLFGVNMPLLYGEGRNAFRRLQEEIIRSSDDHSIFAWGIEEQDMEEVDRAIPLLTYTTSLLATSPKRFRSSTDVVTFRPAVDEPREPYSLTNIGLRITLPTGTLSRGEVSTYALLNCRLKDKPFQQLAMPIVQAQKGASECWRGGAPLERASLEEQHRFKTKLIVVNTGARRPTWSHDVRFSLRLGHAEAQGVRLLDVSPPSAWNSEESVWSTTVDDDAYYQNTHLKRAAWLGLMRFDIQGQQEMLLRLGQTTWRGEDGGRHSQGCVRLFTLKDSKHVDMKGLVRELSNQKLESVPTIPMQPPFETLNALVAGHTGFDVEVSQKTILGEDICLIDIVPRSKSLARVLDRLPKFLSPSGKSEIDRDTEL